MSQCNKTKILIFECLTRISRIKKRDIGIGREVERDKSKRLKLGEK